jgi:hypothetical protein
MVSKLNVRPFQSVNSPLVEPVSMRRDSGVHYILLGREGYNQKIWKKRTSTTFTGQRILLVEVCTNLVHKDVEGLSGYAFGGKSYGEMLR